jgi:hypothetical protein
LVRFRSTVADRSVRALKVSVIGVQPIFSARSPVEVTVPV